MNTQENQHEDPGVSMNPQPEARADGKPQPVFYGYPDESALSKKLLLHGGAADGIVSFEGMLPDGLTPPKATDGVAADISFLREYSPPKEMASGESPCPVFRFFSVPNKPYTTKLPTCLGIIHELGYETKFTSWSQNFLDNQPLPFEGNHYDLSDQIHTDGAEQYMYYKKKDLDNENDQQKKEEIKKSIESHDKLKSYVKNGRMYYAIFHSKRRDEDGWTEPKYVYAFAVGISPNTGNIVGVFSMAVTSGVTSGDHEPVSGDTFESGAELKGDAGCIKFRHAPKRLPDGSPAQLFFQWKNESMLSEPLMLWGNYNGIVSFDERIPDDFWRHETADADVEFLRSYEYTYIDDDCKYLPLYPGLGLLWNGMAKGTGHCPMFRFICVPKRPYTDRMPTGLDIILDLHNEGNFTNKYENIDLNLEQLPYPGNEREWNDEVHTDRTEQYMFHTVENLRKEEMEAADEGDGDKEQVGTDENNEMNDEEEGGAGGEGDEDEEFDEDSDIKKSVEAHKKLEGYVKRNRLYYAVFHSKPSADNDGDSDESGNHPQCKYAFAVGVSPSTGHLVGVCALSEVPKPKGDEGERRRWDEIDDDFYYHDEGCIWDDDLKPPAHPDGVPQHLFLEKNDESVLEKKVMLWGGYEGVVSFDGTLTNEMKCARGNEDTNRDIEFLKTFPVPDSMQDGSSTVPVFRFLCVPDEPYLSGDMPTGNEVIRDMGYEKHFQGHQRGLTKSDNFPYAGRNCEHNDELHTDHTQQCIFSAGYNGDDNDPTLKILEKRARERGELTLKESSTLSKNSHKDLQGFVKKGQLYYGMLHSKMHYNIGCRFADTVYAFAVGVSPRSGNLVGVFAMQGSKGLTR